jgi:hypothetical protein
MLQIDPMTFLAQVAGLFAWICLAALVYSIVEKALGGGNGKPEEPTPM